MEQELLKRIQILEDIDAIRKLKHMYCYACDNGYDVPTLIKLFSPDATWVADGFGRFNGPKEIGAFFCGVSEKIAAAAHLVVNDYISINDDGLSATGKWRNIQPATIIDDNGQSKAMWLLAQYDESYVKIKGQWLIQKLVANIQFFAPHDSGWAEIWPGS